MERALDNINANINNTYKVEVLTAMTWWKRAWNELPETAIENCWTHTGLMGIVKDVLAEYCEDVSISELETGP